MSLFDERRAIEDRLVTGWAASEFANVPIQFENTPLPATGTSQYISLQIISDERKQIEISGDNPLTRNVGIVHFDLFAKADSGSAAARKMGDVLDGIFFRATFALGNSGRITVKNTDFHYRGLRDGRAWWTLRYTYWRDSY